MDLTPYKQYSSQDNCPGALTGQDQLTAVTFDNSDLVDGTLSINHLRNASLVLPLALFNADGILQDPAGIFTVVDANTCKYSFSGELEAGKYLFILKFLYL